ncbi:hypothetical protein [Sodalis ligni]|uniref:Copper resistance protein ScsC N-terminal domain-containing protein n=2 Tax=Sodalis TaxID=84565 RepID=A0A4R1NCM6_9GAMM|nr:hypothetical protein EZJ58_3468 [Sodalis ligni]
MKTLLINILILIPCLMAAEAALAISPVPAPEFPDDTSELSPEQQAQIGKIAAEYLLAHPEILLQINSKLQAGKALSQPPHCAPVKNTGTR